MGGEGVGKGEVDTPTSHSAVFMYARRVLVGRQWGRSGERGKEEGVGEGIGTKVGYGGREVPSHIALPFLRTYGWRAR